MLRAIRHLALASIALASCRGEPSGSPPAPPPPITSAIPGATAAALKGPRTTSGEIAVGNLGSQIAGAEKLAALHGDAERIRLVDLLLDRGTFLGKIADLERALVEAEALVKALPQDPRAYLARAGAHAALHRFSEASADVTKAETLKAEPAQLRRRRASLLEATGEYDQALDLRRQEREAAPTLTSLGSEAALLGEMGRRDESVRRFDEARQHVRDTSPFPVAWLDFQEGLMWEHADDLARAHELYRAAHTRLPAYAHAAGHLALLEPPKRGIEILRAILTTSDDPEYLAALARLTNLEKSGEGADSLEQARRRYDELTARQPLAFADHAGWFWLGSGGDPKKAFTLARQNLEARKTPAAFELFLAAALDTRDTPAACEAVERASTLKYTSVGLHEVSARAYEACGQADRAGASRKAANASRAAP